MEKEEQEKRELEDKVYDTLKITKDFDCFRVFGLPFGASENEVKERYGVLALRYRIGFDSTDPLANPLEKRIIQVINAAKDKCTGILEEKKKSEGQPSWIAETSKKVSEKIKKGWDESEKFACAQPKLATAFGLSGAVIGSCLAYKTLPWLRKSVDRKAESLKNRFDNSYYDFVEQHVAPIKFKWEDLQEESITRGDVARLGGVIGLGYVLKKTNDAFNITDCCIGKLSSAKDYVMPTLRDLQQFALQKLNSGYECAKHNPGRTLAFFAGAVTLLCIKQLYDSLTEETCNYHTLIKSLWASLSEEQVAQLDPNLFLELVNHAGESPSILLETPEFVSLLTDEQYECLESAIADFQKQAKRLKIAS